MASKTAWADGRSQYLTFLVDIDTESVTDTLGGITDELAAFDCLRTAPLDYLHTTVKQVGFMVEDPTGRDELSRASVERIAESAETVFSDLEPFGVTLPRLNVFPNVVFCEVQDDGRLWRPNRDLQSIAGVPAYRYDGDDYRPHVTLAEFCAIDGHENLLDWLARDRDVDESFVVDAIELTAVDPSDCFPAFRTVRRYPL